MNIDKILEDVYQNNQRHKNKTPPKLVNDYSDSSNQESLSVFIMRELVNPSLVYINKFISLFKKG